MKSNRRSLGSRQRSKESLGAAVPSEKAPPAKETAHRRAELLKVIETGDPEAVIQAELELRRLELGGPQ